MDRRVQYTKKIIVDTFLSLLEEKEISKITVTEICKIADINRATFYRYYLDVYDLKDKIEEDFRKELMNSPAIDALDEQESVYAFSKEILTIFEKNKKLVKILFNTNHNIYFLNEVLELAYEKCLDKWSKELGIDTDMEEVEHSIIFIFNGALGIVNYWVKNDFDKDIEEIADIIQKLSLDGARKYLLNRKKSSH
ncbi:MAG: TetR/AcrR family transcriptional regulator C-terminal domain-containing protein [Bacilli bacterium]|nr:TetR/AcrR family transcriptional regulator C-terminal domain-containing protein [Bacilli bacterium]